MKSLLGSALARRSPADGLGRNTLRIDRLDAGTLVHVDVRMFAGGLNGGVWNTPEAQSGSGNAPATKPPTPSSGTGTARYSPLVDLGGVHNYRDIPHPQLDNHPAKPPQPGLPPRNAGLSPSGRCRYQDKLAVDGVSETAWSDPCHPLLVTPGVGRRNRLDLVAGRLE